MDGCERENWARVFPSSAIAMAAAITVSGAAMPAAVTIVAKPKKKLIAGAMFASVAAAISKSDRTPRARRAGRWALLSCRRLLLRRRHRPVLPAGAVIAWPLLKRPGCAMPHAKRRLRKP